MKLATTESRLSQNEFVYTSLSPVIPIKEEQYFEIQLLMISFSLLS